MLVGGGFLSEIPEGAGFAVGEAALAVVLVAMAAAVGMDKDKFLEHLAKRILFFAKKISKKENISPNERPSVDGGVPLSPRALRIRLVAWLVITVVTVLLADMAFFPSPIERAAIHLPKSAISLPPNTVWNNNGAFAITPSANQKVFTAMQTQLALNHSQLARYEEELKRTTIKLNEYVRTFGQYYNASERIKFADIVFDGYSILNIGETSIGLRFYAPDIKGTNNGDTTILPFDAYIMSATGLRLQAYVVIRTNNGWTRILPQKTNGIPPHSDFELQIPLTPASPTDNLYGDNNVADRTIGLADFTNKIGWYKLIMQINGQQYEHDVTKDQIIHQISKYYISYLRTEFNRQIPVTKRE